MEDVRRGDSRVLVVVGEPGIGKTALLEAAAARAGAAGLLTLEGRAAEHEREVPFALAVAALDDHVATLHPTPLETLGPALGAVLPAAAGGARAAAATARRRALPLPPRAARAGRAAGARAARRADPRRPALGRRRVAGVHPAPAAPAAARAAPARARAALRRIAGPAARCPPAGGLDASHLDPLDHDDSLALLADVRDARVRERIAREAGGNPLFLCHSRASPSRSTLPPCVLAAVAPRSALLGAAERALLEGAAVAGDPFDPELAAVAAELAPTRRRSTGWSPPSSCGRPARARRSRSGTRSCGAPSTTPRRPRGGSARTSGSRRRSRARGAARERARAPRRALRAAGRRGGDRGAERGRGRGRRAPRRRPPRAGTRPRCGSCRTPTRAGGSTCAPARARARRGRAGAGGPRRARRGARAAAAERRPAAARPRRRLRGAGEDPRPARRRAPAPADASRTLRRASRAELALELAVARDAAYDGRPRRARGRPARRDAGTDPALLAAAEAAAALGSAADRRSASAHARGRERRRRAARRARRRRARRARST